VAEPIVRVKGLQKEFRQGFFRRKVQAVKNVSFEVRRGDIFGFLGPNGAGKTTTIKILTGLIAKTAGEAELLGKPIPTTEVRRKVGFLPENPYVYPYLTPAEFVEMCGRLSGIGPRAIRDRTRRVLEQVGIAYAADRPVKRLSKGMLQRTGLAAALVADPELLILDEPMSGLDPVGRKEVRDLIVAERDAGRTIFFSTHILTDAQTLCDRVTILRNGEVVVSGRLRDLLRGEEQRTEITLLSKPGAGFEDAIDEHVTRSERRGDHLIVEVAGKEAVTRVLERALSQQLEVLQVIPRHETLEDVFVREAFEPRKSDVAAEDRQAATGRRRTRSP
jgi:ABC-2 type transport system ATP-binding protein